MVAPFLSFAVLALVIFGAVRAGQHSYSVRSQFIAVWCLLMIPMILLNPGHIVAYVVPLLLLLGIGLEQLVDYPYARVLALLPLSLLLAGIAMATTSQYVYTQLYNPQLADAFKPDYVLIERYAREHRGDRMTVVVSPDDLSRYQLLSREYSHVELTTDALRASGQRVLVANDAGESPGARYVLQRLIPDARYSSAPVARVYSLK
jgi:hypothetical protein